MHSHESGLVKPPTPSGFLLSGSESMAAAAEIEEAKLRLFHQWLQANGVELRGCTIRYCGPNRGFGVFFTADGDRHTSSSDSEGVVVMVAPLDLAITPMRVLQDPVIGPRCRALFEEGDVDDRFLVMLYLTVERLRPDSPWKPYLDMLPNTFGNPLWFTEDELAELKGTTLYRATLQQRKKLQALYDDKLKGLVEELLCYYGESESVREVQFEDFLWANSIFWTRALNIPFPRSYVFPESPSEQDSGSVHDDTDSGAVGNNCLGEIGNGEEHAEIVPKDNEDETSKSTGAVTVWVEGLVPGIDFCNHGLKAAATWEVDQTGSVTGVPTSMYLVLADQRIAEADTELYISYGNKGNEELLYLYGFVINNNPDDYLMVHYPMEAFQNVLFFEQKAKLLEIQKGELRCLLPRSLLELGILSGNTSQDGNHNKRLVSQLYNHSWCGQRKVPSYINQLVFPQDFLAALRTIAMREHELIQVTSLLEELVRSGEERQPSDKEVEAAVWEACGDYGALELLVDLLRVKLIELEDGSGTEACDAELLEKFRVMELENDVSCRRNDLSEDMLMSSNKYSSVVYRRGQKHLTSSFLKEAEHALELCASEEP